MVVSNIYAIVYKEFMLLREEFSHRISTDLIYYDLFSLINSEPRLSRHRGKVKVLLYELAKRRNNSLMDICSSIDAVKVYDVIVELVETGGNVGYPTKILLQHMAVYLRNVRSIRETDEAKSALSRWFDSTISKDSQSTTPAY